MTLKATFVVQGLLNNQIFDIQNSRDNYVHFYYQLQRTFLSKGVNLSTQDINTIETSDIIIYNDINSENDLPPTPEQGQHSYNLMLESPLYCPKNFDKELRSRYKKTFTCFDELVDNISCFKVQYSYLFPEMGIVNLRKKTKCCAMIAGNKSSNHEKELYSERLNAIKWFEKNKPDDFDLYGMGWDNEKQSLLARLLRTIKIGNKYVFHPRPSFRGRVIHKKPILEQYKFAIAYENIRDIPGYITEKIFDCFFSDCIPIYIGANNISSYIPENCYIDKRKFNSYSELYRVISSMSDDIYLEYINNIRIFLQSDEAKQFYSTRFAEIIVEKIMSDLPQAIL